MNYSELVAQIQDYTENEFTTTVVNTFITQAEQRIYNFVQLPALRKNVTGTVTATTSPNLVTVNNNSSLVALEPFVVSGTGGNGLSAGTYYIVNPAAGVNQITLATSLANAQAGTAITSLTTGAISATTFSASLNGLSNLTFHRML